MRMRRAVAAALTLVSIICAGSAGMLTGQDAASERAYRILGRHAGQNGSRKGLDSGSKAGIDWESLRSQNADTAGWLEVEGTDIDYPVVRSPQGRDGDWYLTHDFQGRPDSAGCPYLDARCGQNGDHLLVYGHRIGLSNRMFSQLSRAHEKDAFDRIGWARWSEPGKPARMYRPLCALEVDMTFEDIQRFDFQDRSDITTWLNRLLKRASAKSGGADALAADAESVMTLVTCSGLIPNQRERTLTIFVSDGA